MTNQQDPLLTASQVAEMLNVQASTVYEWARIGYIPCFHLGAGKKKPLVRFSRSKVLEWIQEKESEGRICRVPDVA